MIRHKKFNLHQRSDGASYKDFEEAFQHYKERKADIEKTFDIAPYNHVLEEPMNYIHLKCDRRHPQAAVIHAYADKINELFNNSEKVVIEATIEEIPARWRSRVYVDHDWFIREAI